MFLTTISVMYVFFPRELCKSEKDVDVKIFAFINLIDLITTVFSLDEEVKVGTFESKKLAPEIKMLSVTAAVVQRKK